MKRQVLLIVLNIFLFQYFFYLKEFSLLYISSKIIFPFVNLLFSLILFLEYLYNKNKIEYTQTFLFIFIYLVFQSSVLSFIYFDQDLIWGLTAQVKLLPLFFLSISFYVWRYLSVSWSEIEVSIKILSWITIFVMYYFEILFDPTNLVIPEGNMFIQYDDFRGFRYNFPIFVIQLFFFVSLYNIKKSYTRIDLIYLFMVIIYISILSQRRIETVSMFAVLFYFYYGYLSSYVKILSIIGFFALIYVYLIFSPVMNIVELISASSIRLSTITIIMDFLKENPLSIIFGVGFINPVSGNSIQNIFGINFWPSDVGWIGVCFEFGLVGLFAFMYIYYILFKEINNVTKFSDNSLIHGLKLYLYKILIASILIPTLPLQTGVVSTMLALVLYFKHFNLIKK